MAKRIPHCLIPPQDQVSLLLQLIHDGLCLSLRHAHVANLRPHKDHQNRPRHVLLHRLLEALELCIGVDLLHPQQIWSSPESLRNCNDRPRQAAHPCGPAGKCGTSAGTPARDSAAATPWQPCGSHCNPSVMPCLRQQASHQTSTCQSTAIVLQLLQGGGLLRHTGLCSRLRLWLGLGRCVLRLC